MDVETELQTYKHSRQGLDEMYTDARRQLRDESQLRQVGDLVGAVSKLLGLVHSSSAFRCFSHGVLDVE